MDLQVFVGAIIGIFIAIIFIYAFSPFFFSLDPWLGIIFWVSMLLLIAGVIISVFRR
jgi:hypothetical protein